MDFIDACLATLALAAIASTDAALALPDAVMDLLAFGF